MTEPLADAVLVADPEPVAHARRRFSASSQHNRTRAPSMGGYDPAPMASDPDTCRICRGEATPEEPLFYPCKCSGSIKFVHQDCLMEWLSHSQKKHCELCKTPFRFTKLYDRSMPKSIPFVVFVTHTAKYLFDNMVVWMRAALVISMWLVWLPYLMRSIWSLMFWVSDEGFGGSGAGPSLFGGALDGVFADYDNAQAAAAALGEGGVCPSSPLFAASTTVATIGGVIYQLPLARSIYGINLTASEPLYTSFFQLLFGSMGWKSSTTATTATDTAAGAEAGAAASVAAAALNSSNITAATPIPASPRHHRSLLSEVRWLNNLTGRPMINRNLIYVLEGQIITVLVILCFILIILVRDYVVQQQPEINMRAAFAAAENQPPAAPAAAAAPADPLENPAAGLRPEDIERLRGPDTPMGDGDSSSTDSARAQGGSAAAEDGGGGISDHSSGDLDDMFWEGLRHPHPGVHGNGEGPSSVRAEPAPLDSESIRQRLGYPAAGPRTSEMPRPTPNDFTDPEDEDTSPLGVNEYLKIFREAQGDREQILHIVRERGLEKRIQPWLDLMAKSRKVAAMLTVAEADAGSAAREDNERDPVLDAGPEHGAEPPDPESTTFVAEQTPRPQRDDSETSSGWTMFNDLYNGEPSSAASKGKEKATDDDPELEAEESSLGHRPLRQRAYTDGPQHQEQRVHPLANNSWTIPEPASPLRAGRSSPGPQSEADDERSEVDAPVPVRRRSSKISIIAEPASIFESSVRRQPSRASVVAESAIRPEFEPRVAEARRRGEEDVDSDDATPTDEHPANGHGNGHAALPEPVALPAPAAPREPPVGFVARVADFMWRDVEAGAVAQAEMDELRQHLGANVEIMEVPFPADGVAENGHAEDGFFSDEDDDDDLQEANVDGHDGPDLDHHHHDEADERDQNAIEAAAAAAMDPEAVDEAEDFEGVMELLGMRGPIAGLFQNAIFCAFLVSVSVFAGIFLPYNIGRVSVWLLAHPTRPLRILFGIVKLVQDVVLVAAGMASWVVLGATRWFFSSLASQFGFGVGVGDSVDGAASGAGGYVSPAAAASYNMSADAALRIVDSFTVEPPIISTSEIRNFSAVSHEALLGLKAQIAWLFSSVGSAFVWVFGGGYGAKAADAVAFLGAAVGAVWEGLKSAPRVLADPSSWVINIGPSESVTITTSAAATASVSSAVGTDLAAATATTTASSAAASAAAHINTELAYWDGTDRFWAVAFGYLMLCLVAALYLHRGRPFSNSQAGQDREASLIDGLNQASGVMKVILIIGIEMLIFPLYCGLLLDFALLPLFENTTFRSRLLFTYNYPLTSIFVHWFVGTGYMFHFALFVSMCRKIMRKGVLYFIRDPDDPEFHPVRDVLERNVTTQLRKILFSAFVYGALVVICLGGVVWGLWAALPNVLPIHYSSNEPVLEFPIDLLFYNFLMPVAADFFKPTHGLYAMYTWWFRKCARGLRITWFLFGERRIDEEGKLALAPESEHRNLAFWRRLSLQLNPDGEVVPRVWDRTFFDGGQAKPVKEIKSDEMAALNVGKRALEESGQIRPDGRFVRTPASDQVKIPKGRQVFLDVTEANRRADAASDIDLEPLDVYATKQYQLVYLPPHFRLRVFAFILSIWIFAAVTGVSFTIIPLLFGRRVFKMLIPPHIRTNDIYAFSIGVYVLGSLAWGLFHLPELWAVARAHLADFVNAASDHARAARRAVAVALQSVRIVYAYFFILVVFPLLASTLLELYCLVPLDTYMYSAASRVRAAATPSIEPVGAAPSPTLSLGPVAIATAADSSPRHTIRVMQAWTIGLLYLRLAIKIVTGWYEDTRLAAAVTAVFGRGYLNPNVSVLTRAFVLPALVGSAVAILGPLTAARFFLTYYGDGGSAVVHPTMVYRLSFPLAAFAVVFASLVWAALGILRSWRVRIRDEAYLIGERLHNFGVGAAGATSAASAHRVDWREGVVARA